jgi:hypothetical protein
MAAQVQHAGHALVGDVQVACGVEDVTPDPI